MKNTRTSNKDGAIAHGEVAFRDTLAKSDLDGGHTDSGKNHGFPITLAGYSTKRALAAALHPLDDSWPNHTKLLELFFNAQNHGCGIEDISPPWENKYGVWMMIFAENIKNALDLESFLKLAASFSLPMSQ